MNALPAFSAIRRRIDSIWPVASLRTYLIAIILLATLPVASLLAYWILADVQGHQRRTQLELQQATDALAQTIERELVSSVDALVALAGEKSIQRRDVVRFREVLREGPPRSNWFSVYLLDSEGNLLFDTSARPAAGTTDTNVDAPLPVFTPPPFHVTTAEDPSRNTAQLPIDRVAQVSDVIDGRLPGLQAVAVEIPITIDGEMHYSLGAWIATPVWQRLVQTAETPPGSAIGVYDRQRNVIAEQAGSARLGARSMSGLSQGTQTASAEPVRVAQAETEKEKEGAKENARENTRGATLEAWQSVALAGWSVNVDVPAAQMNTTRQVAIGAALATGAACLVLGVLLALLMARRLTIPLHVLATAPHALGTEPIVVREVAQLRDALLDAKRLEETVHERLKAKRDLLQSKADEFEALFESSPIGLAFAQDSACTKVLHNAAMTSLFGTSSGTSAATGESAISVLYQGRVLKPDEQPLQRAAASGESVNGMELELRVGDLPPKYVLVNAVPLLDNEGRPRGALCAIVDITERKQGEARLAKAERGLRESQRLIDLAQEAGNVGFFHYLFDTDTLTWTPGLSRLFGMPSVSRESTLKQFLAHVVEAHRERVEAELQRAFADQRDKEVLEFVASLPDGGRRWLSGRIMVSYGNNGRPLQMTAVILDINDQKDAERGRAALTQREYAARIEAETANQAKDEFLAMLGHELRNPLSAIATAIEVLNRVDGGSDTAVSARGIIARQTHHLARLMDDLLDVARVISGKILLARRRVNLAPLVERLVATQRLTGNLDHHDLDIQLDDVWIEADATRIEQVVTNLLTNAIKYTPACGWIKVKVENRGDHAVLEVRDNGEGIPPALLPKVFDLFVQAERTLDRRAGGLGIGLTLVRRLVELHGGTITAASSAAGTVFTVRLPAVEAPEATSEPAYFPPALRRRIAVIEDNADALDSLRDMLELDGHTVWTANDGISGLAVLLEQRPDVAVVDIGLPGLTGFEVAKRSRAAGYAGRMIALSGYSPDNNGKQALVAGFDAYMVKPVNAEILRRILSDH